MVYTVDGANTLPSGLDYAELIIAVTPTGHDTSAIGVYAQAVPQPPRPATENVPPRCTARTSPSETRRATSSAATP